MTLTQLRKSKRIGSSRTSKLQRDSRRRTKQWDLELDIDTKMPTGKCKFDEGQYSITVSGKEFSQPITDYDPIAWDLLVQKCITIHENSHVLYTDFNDFGNRLSERDKEFHRVYKSIHNILEDGRIENLIVELYPVYSQMILHFRCNFMYNNSVFTDEKIGYTENRESESSETVSVYEAVELGLLDKGLLDVGRYEALINQSENAYQFYTEDDRELFMENIHPLIQQTISEVQSTTDDKQANELIFEFVDEIIEYIEIADKGGIKEAGRKDGTNPARPDDADAQSRKAESDIEIDDFDQHKDDQEDVGKPDNVVQKDVDIESELEEQIESETSLSPEQITDEKTDLSEREIDTVPKSVKGKYSSLFEGAQRDVRRIQQHLDIDTGWKRQKNRMTGRTDPSSIIRAHINDDERFKSSIVKDENPDFNLGIIIDRSGSVDNEILKTEISAVLMSVLSLNTYPKTAVGVYEMYQKKVREVLPLGSSPREYEDELTHRYTGGSTPLSEALEITREDVLRNSGGNNKNRILVVTDGKPDSEKRYKKTLKNTTIPVAGISVTEATFNAAGTENYHRHVSVPTDGTGLNSKIIKILSELTD